MLQIHVSTSEEDRFVRLSTELGVIIVPISEWAYAIAHPGLCSPSGQPHDNPPGGTSGAGAMKAI